MSVKILLDLNLSPDWVQVLRTQGWEATHWSDIGDLRAPDRTIMEWAVANGHIVFTHDLDFGTTLALTHSRGPSVLQVRGQEVLPEQMAPVVIAALRQHENDLKRGAIVVVDESRSRVRVLPI